MVKPAKKISGNVPLIAKGTNVAVLHVRRFDDRNYQLGSYYTVEFGNLIDELNETSPLENHSWTVELISITREQFDAMPDFGGY